MKEYELLYLIGESRKNDFRAIDKDVHQIVEKYGGSWLKKQVTFERRLAYPIKHERRGLYVAQRFTLPDADEKEKLGDKAIEDPISRINRELILHKGVLRALIVSAEDLPPLMTKEEKEAAEIQRKQKEEIERGKQTDEKEIDDQLKEALRI